MNIPVRVHQLGAVEDALHVNEHDDPQLIVNRIKSVPRFPQILDVVQIMSDRIGCRKLTGKVTFKAKRCLKHLKPAQEDRHAKKGGRELFASGFMHPSDR